jgi:hypothetical protein
MLFLNLQVSVMVYLKEIGRAENFRKRNVAVEREGGREGR